MGEIFWEITKALEKGESVALATIVRVSGSAPRKEGAKILVKPDGSTVGTIGGGPLENAVIQEALKALSEGKPRLLHYGLRADLNPEDLGICGGDVDVFVDVISPAETLLLIGGGHVSLALAKLAKEMGYRIVVLDEEAKFASRERYPFADEVRAGELSSLLEDFPITPYTRIVIATRSHESDALALEKVVNSPASYIGLLGSRRKVTLIFKHLREKGVEESSLARVCAPVGLDIGAETPEEIAISIMAEMVLHKRGGTGKPLSKFKEGDTA
ncbi:MAG: XdhC/CoxI family protein [Anaerolineae bacterium]|nr:XdhC/CoxI family protein [Anaerolineae bacterium]MDW8102974.1 XdhC/CoxI family protein [Anaerolineae bacterium]